MSKAGFDEIPRRDAPYWGGTPVLLTKEREEIRELRRENYELRRANEILKSASVFSPITAFSPLSAPSATPMTTRWPRASSTASKTELIADRVFRSRSQLELAVVEYISWFNNDRLHESLGDIPPVEFELTNTLIDET